LQAAKAEGKLTCAHCQGVFAQAYIVRQTESITKTPRKSSDDAAITSRLPADTRITTTPEPDAAARVPLWKMRRDRIQTERGKIVRLVWPIVFVSVTFAFCFGFFRGPRASFVWAGLDEDVGMIAGLVGGLVILALLICAAVDRRYQAGLTVAGAVVLGFGAVILLVFASCCAPGLGRDVRGLFP
jgi:hypothetical protein